MMRQGFDPPYIHNNWLAFKVLVKLDALKDPLQEFQIMQAFYSGFTRGLSHAAAVSSELSRKDQDLVKTMIRKELDDFSAMARDIGKKLEVGHANTREMQAPTESPSANHPRPDNQP